MFGTPPVKVTVHERRLGLPSLLWYDLELSTLSLLLVQFTSVTLPNCAKYRSTLALFVEHGTFRTNIGKCFRVAASRPPRCGDEDLFPV
mmetsp:Transcript_41130/g.66242  ORF Transcript_41130/g.66242 Transcript_41130/m.66242 type:complete len:89 (-) Transcript_41130:1024-1290(-)